MITRKGLADEIDRVDDQIDDLQKHKRQIFTAYREQLENDGMGKSAIKLELAALKAAIRQRRAIKQDADALSERDALIEQILEEIQKPASIGTDRATRARAPRTSISRDEETTVTKLPEAAKKDAWAGLDIPEYLRRT